MNLSQETEVWSFKLILCETLASSIIILSLSRLSSMINSLFWMAESENNKTKKGLNASKMINYHHIQSFFQAL